MALAATATVAANTRAPTARELTSFEEFYRREFPAAPAFSPELTVRRDRAGRPWQVAASVAAGPARLAGGVCHLERQQFRYDARAKLAQRLAAEGEAQQWIWLAHDAACAQPARPVRLLAAVADNELAELMRQQAALLNRARLLLAGNTACAPLRSLPFTLTAIQLQPTVAGKAPMAGLVFESDRNSFATVWVRRSGRELIAWSASCEHAK